MQLLGYAAQHMSNDVLHLLRVSFAIAWFGNYAELFKWLWLPLVSFSAHSRWRFFQQNSPLLCSCTNYPAKLLFKQTQKARFADHTSRHGHWDLKSSQQEIVCSQHPIVRFLSVLCLLITATIKKKKKKKAFNFLNWYEAIWKDAFDVLTQSRKEVGRHEALSDCE